jgi:hypothetical protein
MYTIYDDLRSYGVDPSNPLWCSPGLQSLRGRHPASKGACTSASLLQHVFTIHLKSLSHTTTEALHVCGDPPTCTR